MKKILIATTALFALTATAFADGPGLGLSDPVVTAPASVGWDGLYVGVTGGRSTSVADSTECVDQLKAARTSTEEPEVPECVNVTTSTKTSADEYGVFAGYRKDLGQFVLGAEVNRFGELTSLEGQAGLDLGRALVYGFAGVASIDGEDGNVFGGGVDFKVSDTLFVGLKQIEGDYDATQLRVGLNF